MIPVSKSFEIGNTATFEATKFWVDDEGGSGKRDVYLYVTFSKPVAQSGTGSALEASRYNISWDGSTSYKALPTDSYVTLVTPETVRITIPYTDLSYTAGNIDLRVSLVADTDGKYAYESDGYVGYINDTVKTAAISVDKVTATAQDKVKVKFKGVLTSIDANEFELLSVTGATYGLSLDSSDNDGANTTAYFTITNSNKLAPTPNATFKLKGSATTTTITQDNFGFKVGNVSKSVEDEIKPVAEKKDDVAVVTVASTGNANEYKAVVKFNEDITVVDNTSTIKLSVTGGVNVTTVSHTANKNELVVTFKLDAGQTIKGKVVTVELLASNADVKVVKDASGNAAEAFTASVVAD
ncbi:hypothetical protein D3C78_1113400 [compost metagenome]